MFGKCKIGKFAVQAGYFDRIYTIHRIKVLLTLIILSTLLTLLNKLKQKELYMMGDTNSL